MQIANIEINARKLDNALWERVPAGLTMMRLIIRNDGFDMVSMNGKVTYYRAVAKVNLMITPEQCNAEWERMTKEAENASDDNNKQAEWSR